MKQITIALVAATALMGGIGMSGAFAAEQNGASARSPGHEMQDRGSMKGSPGASGYAPGHEMKSDTTGTTSRSGTGDMKSGTAGSTTRR
ncbi:hypothetical protein [Methylobacterium platani]|uniref:Uncharacterized protein n=2 Tax=Methylobacterium platani TaxID=427683 RepID=A0A179S9X7_9HYPH|nr:hypothetical protein [Methylobacterium platani]KMO20030.1 hypothetical protein SQ03_06590 [Methylobacterium platani JCM 14648]OAS22772.1 hypothetical protein A5481_18115 [Methylobacterium platani]